MYCYFINIGQKKICCSVGIKNNYLGCYLCNINNLRIHKQYINSLQTINST